MIHNINKSFLWFGLAGTIYCCMYAVTAKGQNPAANGKNNYPDSTYESIFNPQRDYNDTDFFENGRIKSINRYKMMEGHKMCHFTLYNEDGTVWTQGHYKDGQMNDSLVNYTPQGNVAFIEIWRMGNMWSDELFYQIYPDQTYHFISKKGYYDYKEGTSTEPGKDTPDGFIQQSIDLQSKSMKYYIWKNGKKQEYEASYPDGTIEDIYNGEHPGIYKWINHKKQLVRPYSKEEIKVHSDSALAPTYIELR